MAERKQVLKNVITVGNEGFEITFQVNNKPVKKFVFKDLKHLICFRELIANLPSLKAKLMLLLEGDALAWFESQVKKIQERAINPEQKTKSKKAETKEFDLDAYLSKFNL